MPEIFSSRLPPHFAQHQRFVADFHILEAGRAALENQNITAECGSRCRPLKL